MSDVKKIATRESYGNALAELGAEHENLVVLDADLAGATKTGVFKKAFPERHINCGIAESNMIGVAAGLAAAGKVPFASSFAMFAAGRAYEQVRNSVGYPHLNVKIGATHAGISVGEDGATHQCNEDLALMRTIPGMVVINPSDDIEAKAAVKAAYEYYGPVYMRFGRLAVPVINDNEDYKFEIGKGVVLREGKDVTIIATGLPVANCLEAAEKLAADGIDAKVINIHTIKPLDNELVVAAAKETGKVVTVEEHSVIGGLGSAVCDVLAEQAPTKVLKIGVNDTYGESGPAAHYKMALATNGIEKIQKERVSAFLPYTYRTYISEALGCIKPSKQFFEYVIQDLECNPSQCLMIGDSLTNDMLGAKAVGMDVCYYNIKKKDKPENVMIDYEINSIQDLVKILL